MQRSAFFAAVIIAAGGASCGVEGWAADVVPTGASAATAASAPKPCTDGWDFVATNCQLTWWGITVYGAIDAGFGWQSHGAPWDPRSAVAASYPEAEQLGALGSCTQRVEQFIHRNQGN